MIDWKIGDIWTSEAECIIIPVNSFLVCGAGLAKQAYDLYREDIDAFKKHLNGRPLKVGSCYHIECEDGRVLGLFTTKYDWREPSQYKWIEQGLQQWRYVVLDLQSVRYDSVAFPILGGGLGKLDPQRVKDLYKKYLSVGSAMGVEVWEHPL